MLRSILGVLIGAMCGALVGYGSGVLYQSTALFRGPDPNLAVLIVVLLTGMGALSGAIVGAVGDLVAFLSRTLPELLRTGPEADYRDSRPPASR